MQKTDCPDFDHFDYEKILEWGEAKVVYDDTFVNGSGVVRKNEKLASWLLLWDHGFIGLDLFRKKEDEVQARMAAALFISLWCKGWELLPENIEKSGKTLTKNLVF